MKTYHLCILLLIGLSCTRELDIEPRLFISADEALDSDQGVKTALIGAYDGISGSNLWGGGQVFSELLVNDQDQVFTGTFKELREISVKSILAENSFIRGLWASAYGAVNMANNVLASIDVVKQEDQSRISAEARFIRGSIYFYLVNLYAKTWIDGDPAINPGVPISTSGTRAITPELKLPRSSVTSVYDLIIEDLEYARTNLPEINQFLATSHAAASILSRVYLMQGHYERAHQMADQVIESGLFKLVPEFENVFNQSVNTPEDIFTLQVESQDGDNAFTTYYAGPNAGGRGEIAITDTHLSLYDSLDIRRSFFYEDNFGIRRTAKWQDNAGQDGNVNIVRLAELYLTRSECRFRLGEAEGAAADLNKVRVRAGLPEIAAGNLTLDIILRERFLELAFEGHRLRDIKRTGKSVGEIPFNAPRLVFPIPQREVDVNPNLIQNSGY